MSFATPIPAWFYQPAYRERGPFTAEETEEKVRLGEIAAATLVC